jgi:hypothetical protein
MVANGFLQGDLPSSLLRLKDDSHGRTYLKMRWAISVMEDWRIDFDFKSRG